MTSTRSRARSSPAVNQRPSRAGSGRAAAARTPQTKASSPASLTSLTERRLDGGDARRRRGSSCSARWSKALLPVVQIRTSSRWSSHDVRARLGRRRREAEHREQVADRERDDQRGGEAAALAPPDAAQPDLHRAGQEAHAPQHAGRARPVRRPPSPWIRAPRAGRCARRGGSPAARRAAARPGPTSTLTTTTVGVDAEADVDRPELRPK